jgi:glycosyltransferase involved in cell wall biosynthesis
VPIIVHIVQRMASGGIETLVLDLALADPNIRIISLEGETQALIAQWPNLSALGERFIALNKPLGRSLKLIGQVAKHLYAFKARSVIMHHIGPLVYGGLAARLLGIKMRVHIEHDGWHYLNKRRRMIGRFLDFIVRPGKVAVSHSTAKQVQKALNCKNIEIIPNGVDMEQFKPADKKTARAMFNLPQDAILIGSVGRLVRVKGHDILVEALRFLPSHIHLVLAGDGDQRATLQALAKEHGVSKRIYFLGNCSQTHMLYPAFDVFCLPSRAEGFPRSLIEAQACDICVVATDVGGSSEAVCPVTGHLVDAQNAEKLSQMIEFTLNQQKIHHPRDFVNPKFSFERTSEAYTHLGAIA